MSRGIEAPASAKKPPRGITKLSRPGMERVGGRVAGTPNRYNGDIKRMVVEALEKAGGVKYLVQQAGRNPVAFMGLVGRVLPLQVTGDAGALQITMLHLIAARQISEQMQAALEAAGKQQTETKTLEGVAIDYSKPALE